MSEAAPRHAAGGAAPQGPVAVSLHQPLPPDLEAGRGQFLVVSGDCRADGDAVAAVSLLVDGMAEPAELSPAADGVSFWQAAWIEPRAGAAVDLQLDVRLASGGLHRRGLGAVRGRAVDWQPAGPPAAAVGGLVAVCMATYEPDPDAFRRQVDSIRSQTHGNWLCLVNDDGSSPARWEAMQACCAGDARFLWYRNPENLGFYRNFEKLLTRVPEPAAYVAFADQDDYWYPGKLSRLIEALEADEALLAYSDMRVVDGEGRELAGTYWVNRRNEYRDLGVVLVANTVTGAASVFRRDLLARLVPFPPRVGDAFHDHWLACVAMSSGTVSYVDEPLHDYYQYGSSVIGHCDFVRFTLTQRLAALVRFCFRLCRPSVARPLLRGKYASALAVYRGECRRLRLVSQTIRRRGPVDPERLRVLRLFDGGWRTISGLLRLHLSILFKGQTTDDAEVRLAMGELARRVEKRRLEKRTQVRHADR